MIRRTGGWTLIETMVAIALFGFVLLFVARILSTTARVTRAQTSRSLRQASLQATMRHVERVLQRAPAAAVGWYSSAADGAVLAAHCLSDNPTGPPQAGTFWECFVWDKQARKVFMGRSLASAGFPAPPPRFQLMPTAQMQAILAGETPYTGTTIEGHPIADRVTDFRFELITGPLYKLDIELDVPPGDYTGVPDMQERLRASVSLHPRNRI